MDSNREEKIVLAQPRSFDERKSAAKILVERLHYDLPLALDGMDNKAETAYSAWPERLYVVDRGGRLAYCGAVGPFGFDAAEMERALRGLLALSR